MEPEQNYTDQFAKNYQRPPSTMFREILALLSGGGSPAGGGGPLGFMNQTGGADSSLFRTLLGLGATLADHDVFGNMRKKNDWS